MKRIVPKYGVVIGLAILVVAQMAVLGFRQRSDGALPDSWLQVGDNVAAVRVSDSLGRESPLVTGEPTLLLVFHSECGHCRAVAPLWKAWIEASGSAYHTIAVSSEPLESARAYVAEHEWDAEIRTVEAGRLGGWEHALTSRTPWVFVIDEAGVILAEGHGSRIAELGAVLVDARQEPPVT